MKIEGKITLGDVRQRLIDRIDELKRDKRELFGDEDFVYIGGRTVKGGIINENTSKFYLYVYDKLVKELQDIMLSNDLEYFMEELEKKEILETYKWIKIKKYKDDESLSWEERYKKLEEHHIEETNFLIDKIRDIINLGKEFKSTKCDKLNKELDDALDSEFGSESSVFERAKLVLREHILSNKEQVAKDLQDMREKSKKRLDKGE